ncbi:MAG: hypothetical protein EI684_01330 [Candidatus Viridilinea halotolerans]|uniref:Uncharacterized protein n=1 Tax=Candidatus Viridilinea halotolerans TaxID=2491704 RepID=A0A426UAI1_9CHLR|nr:MAG: hypothetical protein EI684_01330 [Candidatus Viridilinea halotolerans]
MKKYRLDLSVAVVVFIIALLERIRITYEYAWIFAEPVKFVQGDDGHYFAIMMSLLEHEVFGIEGVPTAYRMPFFPLFGAFWHWLLGPEPYVILPVLLVLGAFIPVGTYLLARYFINPLSSFIVSCLMIFDKDMVVYSMLYMTEILFCFCVLWGMLAFGQVQQTLRWPWAVITGLLFGCATLTRANFGPFVFVVLLWFIWLGRARSQAAREGRGEGLARPANPHPPAREGRGAASPHPPAYLKSAITHAVIIGAIVGAMWLPWVIRNYLVFEAFIPFTTQGGSAYYGIYHDQVANQPFGIKYGLWQNLTPPVSDAILQDSVALDRVQRELARNWIQEHRYEAAVLALMQVFQLWAPFSENPLAMIIYTLIGLPALAIFALRDKHPMLISWLILAFMMSAMALASVGVARYAYPLRPVLALTTFMLFQEVAQHISKRRGMLAIRDT